MASILEFTHIDLGPDSSRFLNRNVHFELSYLIPAIGYKLHLDKNYTSLRNHDVPITDELLAVCLNDYHLIGVACTIAVIYHYIGL